MFVLICEVVAINERAKSAGRVAAAKFGRIFFFKRDVPPDCTVAFPGRGGRRRGDRKADHACASHYLEGCYGVYVHWECSIIDGLEG